MSHIFKEAMFDNNIFKKIITFTSKKYNLSLVSKQLNFLFRELYNPNTFKDMFELACERRCIHSLKYMMKEYNIPSVESLYVLFDLLIDNSDIDELNYFFDNYSELLKFNIPNKFIPMDKWRVLFSKMDNKRSLIENLKRNNLKDYILFCLDKYKYENNISIKEKHSIILRLYENNETRTVEYILNILLSENDIRSVFCLSNYQYKRIIMKNICWIILLKRFSSIKELVKYFFIYSLIVFVSILIYTLILKVTKRRFQYI